MKKLKYFGIPSLTLILTLLLFGRFRRGRASQ